MINDGFKPLSFQSITLFLLSDQYDKQQAVSSNPVCFYQRFANPDSPFQENLHANKNTSVGLCMFFVVSALKPSFHPNGIPLPYQAREA